MKKTSSIILTLVASVSITLGSVASSSAQDPNPREVQYFSDADWDTTRDDTVRSETVRSDTVRNYYNQDYVYYDYYYRSPFWNNMFQIWFPTRYYRIINRPGYVPRHLRRSGTDAFHSNGGPRHVRGSMSGRIGGFGHSGMFHGQSN